MRCIGRGRSGAQMLSSVLDLPPPVGQHSWTSYTEQWTDVSGNALNQQLDEANQWARTHHLGQGLLEYVIGYFLVQNTVNNFIYSLQCNVINNSSKCGNSPVTGEVPNKWLVRKMFTFDDVIIHDADKMNVRFSYLCNGERFLCVIVINVEFM